MSNAPLATNGRLLWANLLDRASLALFALLVGTLGMTGAAAAITFPTMRDLGPTLGAYPQYFGTHWNLAAGEVMRRVFDVSDGVTLVAGLAASLSLMLAFALRAKFFKPTLTQWARVLLVLAVLGVIAYQSIWLRPAMNEELFAFIDAAAMGDAPTADLHRENFAALHPTASRTLTTLFMLSFASTALGCWSRRDG